MKNVKTFLQPDIAIHLAMSLIKLGISLVLIAIPLASSGNEETQARIEDGMILDLIAKHMTNSKRFKEIAGNFSDGSFSKYAVVNDYMDDLLVHLDNFIVMNTLDPVPLPDLEESFQWRILLITYHGEMSLKKGWLQGLSTIARNGDVTLRYSYPNLKVYIPLKFNKLLFNYQYVAQFMGLGPTGGVDGEVKGCKYTAEIEYNLINLRASLDKFKLNTLGKIDLKFNGNILTDWLLNIFVEVTLPFIKPIIKLIIEGFVIDGLDVIVNYYNDTICKFLRDC